MNPVANTLFANAADALSSASNGLEALLIHAPADTVVYSDLYGNILFQRPGLGLERSVMLGFTDEHVHTALAVLEQLSQPCARAIELVYMSPLSPALDFAQLPSRAASPAHCFIALSANPPIEQHLKARWYQLNCCVANAQGSAMALSHHAIVLAFHSMQRIQKLTHSLAGPNALQMSFSRIHTLPDAKQVAVNMTVKHHDDAALQVFDQALRGQLPSETQIESLLEPAYYPHSGFFASSLQKTCQHLATRSYELYAASLNDAMYLASQGPNALLTLGEHNAQSARALAHLLKQLAQ